jgi:hypothetical protein
LLYSKTYTILHNEDTILRQIRVAQSKLQYISDSNLRGGMEVYLYDLTNRVKATVRAAEGGRIPLSSDYVIEVECPISASSHAVPQVVFTAATSNA